MSRSPEYYAHLKSDAWRLRRAEALRLAGNRCQVCNASDRLDVHHRTYERFGNENLDDLTVLCRDCHNRFHHDGELSRPDSHRRGRPRSKVPTTRSPPRVRTVVLIAVSAGIAVATLIVLIVILNSQSNDNTTLVERCSDEFIRTAEPGKIVAIRKDGKRVELTLPRMGNERYAGLPGTNYYAIAADPTYRLAMTCPLAP